MLREVISNEWFTVLLIFCLGLLALARFAYSKRFIDFVSVLGNSKYLKIYSREQKFIDQFDALLFLNLIISVAIFSYIAYTTFVETIEFNMILFIKIVLGFGALILIKVLAERLIGSLFEIDELIDQYIFQKTNYKNYIGLILLPVNVILIYGISPTKSIIYAVIGLLLLVNLSGFFTTFKTNQKLLLDNMFYFILYLCALEIGPYIILYKVFN
ncbi:MAG: DUF4271 domain-containing protein [Flavobacteriaceae bacterium]|nr:DUF4271 domain-containing protein [Flavobacteriaceae bacterium]